MKELKLCESDFRFACIVWDSEPVGSGELVKRCEEKLGWKKSTTYTVLRKLCERGILENDNTVVTSLVKRGEVLQYESEQIVQRAFSDSLPQFIASFMFGRKITTKEADEIRKLIEQCEEE